MHGDCSPIPAPPWSLRLDLEAWLLIEAAYVPPNIASDVAVGTSEHEGLRWFALPAEAAQARFRVRVRATLPRLDSGLGLGLGLG